MEDDYGDDAFAGKGRGELKVPPVDYDPTEPMPSQPAPPAQEKWVAKLRIDLQRVRDVMGPQGPQLIVLGVLAQEENAEGSTPGEAFRAARERMKPVFRAYKLEMGPLPVEVVARRDDEDSKY